jgi:hypothetical protein
MSTEIRGILGGFLQAPFRPQNCNIGLGDEILRFRHRKSVFLQRNCEERLHTFTSTHERQFVIQIPNFYVWLSSKFLTECATYMDVSRC